MIGSGHCFRCKNPYTGCANTHCACHPVVAVEDYTAAELIELWEAEGAA